MQRFVTRKAGAAVALALFVIIAGTGIIALMILALDEALPEKQQQEILSIPDVHTVKLVRI